MLQHLDYDAFGNVRCAAPGDVAALGPVDAIDNFDRADSATSLGAVAETGLPWVALSGEWGISNGRAYNVSHGDQEVAAVDVGFADGSVSAVATVAAYDWGLVGRAEDNGNYLLATSLRGWGGGGLVELWRKTNGGFSKLASVGHILQGGQTVTLEAVGEQVRVLVNGQAVITATDPQHGGHCGTMWGIRSEDGGFDFTAARWDDVTFTPMGTLPPLPRYTYTGQERDGYMGGRWYDPFTGTM